MPIPSSSFESIGSRLLVSIARVIPARPDLLIKGNSMFWSGETERFIDLIQQGFPLQVARDIFTKQVDRDGDPGG